VNVPVPTGLPPLAAVDAHLRSRRWQLIAKRAIDIAASAALLALIGPALLLIMLSIRLGSRGPALFSQQRWGWRESSFRLYKLRTMATDARVDRRAHEDGVLLKPVDDPRVTRLGRLLRRSSVDELPQLWNVLVGNMSLVGPRPLMLHMLEPYPQLRGIRCRVRPGITGLWQINDRAHHTHAFQMATWDLQYVQQVSLRLDILIMLRTVRAVISGRGAV